MAKRGRPPLALGEHSTSVSVRIPNGMYDRLCAAAVARGLSVPEFIRETLDLGAFRPFKSTPAKSSLTL